MNIPEVTQVVPTTRHFKAGQTQAWKDANLGSSGPNDEALSRAHPEFAAGYRYEWAEYIAPFLDRQADN